MKLIAKQFKKMVKKILKKIKKTGSYSSTPQIPTNFKEALLLAVYEQEQIKQLIREGIPTAYR